MTWVMHRYGWPRRHEAQLPHGGSQFAMTWSPTVRPATPSPMATTSPAASCPRMAGIGWGRLPLRADRSEWQTPAARTRILTWPGPGPTATTSSRISILSASIEWSTAARTTHLQCQAISAGK